MRRTIGKGINQKGKRQKERAKVNWQTERVRGKGIEVKRREAKG